ncbi:MAG: hypothetical protein IJS39_15820 [Synergistaceae bacterium]|nr:hypothetical protein [Synergistaceae bacterium]
MSLSTKNILDELERVGEEKVRRDLSLFSCPPSPKIENFIRNRAIDFARRKISITYIVNDLEGCEILGFVTLAHKAVMIPPHNLSNTSRKRLERFARFDKPTGQYMASAFLIAQLGKNYAVDNGKRISGAELLSIANDILTDVQHLIGGGVIYLDSEDTQKLMQFYEHEAFYKFGERYSDEEEQRYIQYLRFF